LTSGAAGQYRESKESSTMKSLVCATLPAILLALATPALGSPSECQANFPTNACGTNCATTEICNVTGHCVTGCKSAGECGSGEICTKIAQCAEFPCINNGPLPSPSDLCATVDQLNVWLGWVGLIGGCPDVIVDDKPPAGKPVSFNSCTWHPEDKTALYKLWAVDGSNAVGPIEVCVGPDLMVRTFKVESQGAQVTYKATVCNYGSKVAEKFRVGFWHDRSAEPAATDMGEVFKGIVSLDAATACPAPRIGGIGTPIDTRPMLVPSCVDVVVAGGLRPNGSFKAWCRVDSGDFVVECRESNNGIAPYVYKLDNPDLEVHAFSATVAGNAVNYEVTVCNIGTSNVPKFYVDVYFNRAKQPPVIGEPGDVVKPVLNLDAGKCTKLTFQRASTPNGTYTSYAFADPDDFISEPNESNNLSKQLEVQVGPGSGPSSGCVDSDKDGFGVGPDCKGQQDCDDNDAEVHPDAKEACNGVDDNCNYTVDEGCPGVDCIDHDGDTWGVGKDCVLQDCDDTNPNLHPLAPETCGNMKDDNCDGIIDDGCPGRQCTDADGDGYGEGAACPKQQDCNDHDVYIHPGVKEVCGDGVDNNCNNWIDEAPPCTTSGDNDGDGWFVGAISQGPPDCNDTNPAIHPYATEECNGIDDNCNGSIDEGCPGVDCVDKDNDGWPVGKGCQGAQDCDDTDPMVHPWASEICGDKKDNNCNLSIDDGCDGVDCKDNDVDGWPAGKDCAPEKSDCDDGNPALNPWMPEICEDGIDNNCNNQIDEGCASCADTDGDSYGVGPRCTNWDCDDHDPTTYPGAKQVCDGKDHNCDGAPDTDCTPGCGCEVSETPTTIGGVMLILLALLLLGARRRER
jgi:MYXO-CTERM domain-containing protein